MAFNCRKQGFQKRQEQEWFLQRRGQLWQDQHSRRLALLPSHDRTELHRWPNQRRSWPRSHQWGRRRVCRKTYTHKKFLILSGCSNFSLTSCRTRVQPVLWARAMPCQIHTPTPPPFLWAIPWKTSLGVSFWGAPLEHRQLNLLETLQKKKRRRKPLTNGRKKFSAEERKVNLN